MFSWWLVLESRRLWGEMGPCAALVGPLSHLSFASIWLAGDYRTGHLAVGHVLSVSQQRGWEPETSQARFLYAMTVGPWFDPLRQNVALSLRAEAGLVKGGDLQNACFTYYATISQLLDCAPTLDDFQAELDRTLAFAARTGNAHVQASLLPYRKLARELLGEEPDGEEPGPGNPTSAGIHHSIRALSALLRGDLRELAAQVQAAREFTPYMMATHLLARVRLLNALALAQQAKLATAQEREPLLARLDRELSLISQRAADAPGNFAHQVAWLTAERAWGARDLRAAMRGFNAALEAVKRADFPWQRALLTERAALFHQECGLAHLAGVLMSEAVELYREWGAQGKVRQLEGSYPFLRQARRRQDPAAIALSADAVDMLAILQASRALSSETSLERLTAVLVEVLEKMSGATAVSLLVREEQDGEWQLLAAGAGGRLTVEEAATAGRIPLSLFRYLERTREPLVVEDATRDDRFRHDPYLAGYRCCSMLAVPILNHGAASALLLLENSLSPGAFTPERLDAVTLIAGQLAVSLENALLYQGLEEAVGRRTAELASANRALQEDIVERRRAEQETRDAYRRISDILEFLPDATFVVDAGGRVIAWNRAMELLSGVDKQEILGRGGYAYAVPFYGEPRKVLIDMLDEEAAVGERHYPGVKSDGKTLTAEARVMVGDRLYWMWSAATPLYNLQGQKVGGIQSLRDVTELRKSEQERSRMEAQLHHASLMEALMGQLGHDLKTPLTPLCALLPMIGRKCQDPDLARMLDICQQSVRQIQALSSKAQELVRLSCQQTPLHRSTVLLRDAVEGCLAGCGSLFVQRGGDCRNQVA
ncbi:MAG TPA: GAF domain-containing protein, partial [Geomonas sp.]|nr:GAF domain-containing protein [Geomonas sp.]